MSCSKDDNCECIKNTYRYKNRALLSTDNSFNIDLFSEVVECQDEVFDVESINGGKGDLYEIKCENN